MQVLEQNLPLLGENDDYWVSQRVTRGVRGPDVVQRPTVLIVDLIVEDVLPPALNHRLLPTRELQHREERSIVSCRRAEQIHALP